MALSHVWFFSHVGCHRKCEHPWFLSCPEMMGSALMCLKKLSQLPPSPSTNVSKWFLILCLLPLRFLIISRALMARRDKLHPPCIVRQVCTCPFPVPCRPQPTGRISCAPNDAPPRTMRRAPIRLHPAGSGVDARTSRTHPVVAKWGVFPAMLARRASSALLPMSRRVPH